MFLTFKLLKEPLKELLTPVYHCCWLSPSVALVESLCSRRLGGFVKLLYPYLLVLPRLMIDKCCNNWAWCTVFVRRTVLICCRHTVNHVCVVETAELQVCMYEFLFCVILVCVLFWCSYWLILFCLWHLGNKQGCPFCSFYELSLSFFMLCLWLSMFCYLFIRNFNFVFFVCWE